MHFKHISLAFACQSSNVLTLNHLPADSPGLLLIPYLLLSHLSIMRHSNTCHSCSRSRHSRYVCEFSSFVYINKIDDFERPSRYTYDFHLPITCHSLSSPQDTRLPPSHLPRQGTLVIDHSYLQIRTSLSVILCLQAVTYHLQAPVNRPITCHSQSHRLPFSY